MSTPCVPGSVAHSFSGHSTARVVAFLKGTHNARRSLAPSSVGTAALKCPTRARATRRRGQVATPAVAPARTDAAVVSVQPGTGSAVDGSGSGASAAAAGRLEAALAALLSVGGAASSLQVTEGPFGRGLFVTSPAAAGQPLFSMPDVNTLIVPDPENDPYSSSDDEDPVVDTAAAAAGLGGRDQGQGGPAVGLGQAAVQAEAAGLNWREERDSDLEGGQRSYLDRWQRHHGLRLPAWLQGFLGDADTLPAPARLALWLMWLRRHVQVQVPASGGGGAAAAAAAVTGLEELEAEEGRGVPFWRAYVRCLPPPELVTCLAVFSEAEAALLQVPAYKRQWSRTRANLSRLLDSVNAAAAAEAAGGTAATAAAGGYSHSGHSYSLDELCYCYSMAISRCFHLPGRMLLVALADMANHQPLWQASAYPWWHWQEPAAAAAGAATSLTEAADAGFSTLGCFQFRAVRPLAAGDEVCICYSEGANDEQLFDYGFVRQANPYDRLDLSDGAEGLDPDADADAGAVLTGPAGQHQLCWPALVAAAGFWARAEDPASDSSGGGSHDAIDAGSVDGPHAAGLSAAEEQSLLLPRSVGGGDNGSSSGLREMIANVAAIVSSAATAAVDADAEAAERLRQQRRRSALLSLPHTAYDTAALRRWGLARAASAAEELRRGLAARVAAQLASQQNRQRRGAAAAAPASGGLLEAAAAAELAAVDALAARVAGLAAGLGSSLADDEAVWEVLTEPAGAARQARAAAVASGSAMASAAAAAQLSAATAADSGARGRLGAAFQSLFGGGSTGSGSSIAIVQQAPVAATALSAAELLAAAAQHDSARGRTALLARLEYKRLLDEAADVLRTYRQVVAEAAAPRRLPAAVRF